MAHVFVSYVRQNRDEVDRLAAELKHNGVPVWLDRNDIEPGARWRDAIKGAIQTGSFFMACFSREYQERDRTHMNEELTLAIDELRARPSDKTCFIPVLINQTEIPSRRISASEDLSDIQAVNLYENWTYGIHRIIAVLKYDDPLYVRAMRLVEIVERGSNTDRLYAIRELQGMGTAAKPALF
ncbi:MAG TPA: toll/interleukin-1 receptor domain-containing protein, partial [Xanthobacteraceae bacterium]|nr:toll/interleukin-1 receptor domain-containing protein [Xanthobacteraceae bacterium]